MRCRKMKTPGPLTKTETEALATASGSRTDAVLGHRRVVWILSQHGAVSWGQKEEELQPGGSDAILKCTPPVFAKLFVHLDY